MTLVHSCNNQFSNGDANAVGNGSSIMMHAVGATAAIRMQQWIEIQVGMVIRQQRSFCQPLAASVWWRALRILMRWLAVVHWKLFYVRYFTASHRIKLCHLVDCRFRPCSLVLSLKWEVRWWRKTPGCPRKLSGSTASEKRTPLLSLQVVIFPFKNYFLFDPFSSCWTQGVCTCMDARPQMRQPY